MALDNMSDGVGKKIVEALKMQDEVASDEFLVEEEPVIEEPQIDESESFVEASTPVEEISTPVVKDEILDSTFSPLNFAPAQNSIDNAFQQSLVNNLGVNAVAQIQDDFNYPANVAVLKQLIAKLPTGVSKQTGALIIKQTMEALGISMSSVLQEARQVQETFANNARECQTNIVEYRKQITVLEAKAQQYQKQYAVMNDIINLFLQTGKM
jgi:cysteinyl-tRNA synthetase